MSDNETITNKTIFLFLKGLSAATIGKINSLSFEMLFYFLP